MRILGVERNSFATNHYRVAQPLRKAKQHGLADVSTFGIADLSAHLDKVTELVIGADVILVYAPSNEDWLSFIKLCRQHGKLVVADYDDDPFNVSPWNAAYQHSGIQEVAYVNPDGTKDMLWAESMTGSHGETGFFNIERNLRARDLFAVNFRKADLVTCTTDVLADTLRAHNPNVAVVPNLIDLGDYPRLDFVKRGVRIGWQGGSSHYEDLWVIVEPMRRLLKAHPDATFVYLGDLRLAGVLKSLPQHQVEYHGWVPHAAYSYKLATLNLDIGLCPLADNAFNRNKSAIKWMEYSAVGATTAASAIPPYAPVIDDGRTGLLTDAAGWFDALDRLVRDPVLRRRLASLAYEQVEADHNADTHAHRIIDAYGRMLKAPLLEVPA